jgi:uncharacterized Zn finger protein
MAQFSRTWWGQRFIESLEAFSDSARLGRGRAYARNGKIKEHHITNGKITAKVRGSVNPYFGVYKEPLYSTSIEIQPITATDWSKLIAAIGSKASLISKLLLGEVPDNIEETFSELGLHLLPHSRKDFKIECSCPDYGDPCKHIAGVCYLIAAELDQDPFLLFELRGISRSQIQQELKKSSLGKALSGALDEAELAIVPTNSYYTKPITTPVALPVSPKDFWQGTQRLPQTIDHSEVTSISAVVVKKGGDFPPFWDSDSSFIVVMEELYERIRKRQA